MATRSGRQQTLTRATLASSARRCSSRRWPGPQMLCNPGGYGQCGDGVLGASRLTPGVHGWSQTDNGVEGESDSATGVWGASRRAYGVLGQTGGFPFGPRFTDPNNPLSRGDQRSVPAGVWGTATDTFGVAGSSFKASGAVSQNSFGVVAPRKRALALLPYRRKPPAFLPYQRAIPVFSRSRVTRDRRPGWVFRTSLAPSAQRTSTLA